MRIHITFPVPDNTNLAPFIGNELKVGEIVLGKVVKAGFPDPSRTSVRLDVKVELPILELGVIQPDA